MKLHNLRVHQKIYGNILVGLSFFILTLINIRILLPEIKTEAESQIAEQTVEPYEMSMANDPVATINITPTTAQTVYAASNNITVRNTCDAGATIDMTMESSTSNSLIRIGADTATKEISATTSADLDDYSWGYTLDNSSFYAVPKKGETAAIIYDESTAQSSELTVPVKFGVKTDNSLPSGAYTSDVVYTMTPKAGCLVYNVIWDFDGGTAKSGATYPTNLGWSDTTDLSQLTPTREGYTFAGWTNGSSIFSSTETAANLNPNNIKEIMLKAIWTLFSDVKTFSYTGTAQTFSAPYTGYYQVQLWGAQGGNMGSYTGGNGGYVKGAVKINKGASLYLFIGQQSIYGGWNGGGKGGTDSSYGAGGGGATDVRTVSGNWDDTVSLRSRIIVAAGGGGASNRGSCYGDGDGGAGGGLSGIAGTTINVCSGYTVYTTSGGTQTSAGNIYSNGTVLHTASFGAGSLQSGKSYYAVGGGAGWYGGGGRLHGGGAGGSSYISGHTGAVAVTSTSSSSPKSGCTTGTTNNACSISPYGYTFTSTQMIAGNAIMPNTAGTGNEIGHSGNGYAKITWLGDTI